MGRAAGKEGPRLQWATCVNLHPKHKSGGHMPPHPTPPGVHAATEICPLQHPGQATCSSVLFPTLVPGLMHLLGWAVPPAPGLTAAPPSPWGPQSAPPCTYLQADGGATLH